MTYSTYRLDKTRVRTVCVERTPCLGVNKISLWNESMYSNYSDKIIP